MTQYSYLEKGRVQNWFEEKARIDNVKKEREKKEEAMELPEFDQPKRPIEKYNPHVENKPEIIWNIINAAMAGFLVFLGSLAGGEFSWAGFAAAIVAALIVMVTKFKSYWSTQEDEYSTKMFNFI